jgi:NTF2 fold immunity protein
MEDVMPPWWPMSGIDLIPDAETALKLGRIILDRYYGEGAVAKYEPYHATLYGEEWYVLGTSPHARADDDHNGIVRLGGGHPGLSISKKDAKVLEIALQK